MAASYNSIDVAKLLLFTKATVDAKDHVSLLAVLHRLVGGGCGWAVWKDCTALGCQAQLVGGR